MNRLILITILFVSSIAFSQETSKSSKGELAFTSEVIDYGKIVKNADGKRIFTFKNIGNAPVNITTVKGSCGCTVATKPNKPIMPGETAEIGVNYATDRIGGFSKTITVISDASNSRKTLRIKGIVTKPTFNSTNNATASNK